MADVSTSEVVYIDDVQMFTDIATDLGIKSIRHTDWSSTSSILAGMGLQIESRLLVHG